MSAVTSTPQLPQTNTPGSQKTFLTPTQRQSSHRLENATGPERRTFSLHNQGITNVDAATIHAWRHNVGQNNQDGSQTLSPPASPSLGQNSTFNPSAPCTVTAKCSSVFSANHTKLAAHDAKPDPPARVQRAFLARGNSEISKQCSVKPSSICEASGLEAKRQKDLVVTEKMIGE